jgi:hypothetical protein
MITFDKDRCREWLNAYGDDDEPRWLQYLDAPHLPELIRAASEARLFGDVWVDMFGDVDHSGRLDGFVVVVTVPPSWAVGDEHIRLAGTWCAASWLCTEDNLTPEDHDSTVTELIGVLNHAAAEAIDAIARTSRGLANGHLPKE